MEGVTAQIGSGQLGLCISKLKEVNRTEFSEQVWIAILISIYFGYPLLFMAIRLGITGSFQFDNLIIGRFTVTWLWITEAFALIVGICLIYIFLAIVIFTRIRERMRQHASSVFAATTLVADVISLPSDRAAYRSLLSGLLVREWLFRTEKEFDLQRRAKAIVARFGAWSKHYGHAAEPWAVRLALYAGGLTAIAYEIAVPLVAVINLGKSAPEDQFAYIFIRAAWGMIAVLLLWRCVFLARRAGVRRALIDYLEAEGHAWQA